MRPVALACVLLGSTSAAAQGFVEWRVTSVFERLLVTLGVSMQPGARPSVQPQPAPLPSLRAAPLWLECSQSAAPQMGRRASTPPSHSPTTSACPCPGAFGSAFDAERCQLEHEKIFRGHLQPGFDALLSDDDAVVRIGVRALAKGLRAFGRSCERCALPLVAATLQRGLQP